jgi:hypothetical protein
MSRRALWINAAVIAVLWGFAFAAIWWQVDCRAWEDDKALAVTVTILVGEWLMLERLTFRLIRLLANDAELREAVINLIDVLASIRRDSVGRHAAVRPGRRAHLTVVRAR